MKSTGFKIIYKKSDYTDSNFELASIGESLTGFDGVLKDFFKAANFNQEIEIGIEGVEKGSIVISLLFHVNPEPLFTSVKDLLDFIQVVDIEMFKKATAFFTQIDGVHRGINDFFKQFPFDQELVLLFLTVFVTRQFGMAEKQKKELTLIDIDGNKYPIKFAARLRTMVVNGRFKKALKPLRDGTVDVIEIGGYKNFSSVYDENLENFLPDDERILPDLENGQEIKLTGRIEALQSTKGETIKFRAFDVDKEYQLFTAHPEDGIGTENFTDYYKKEVILKAEIYRKTLFKMPELIIKEISLLQEKLL